MLTREFSHDVTGDVLGGVFSEVTPLGDLRTGRSGETKCYAYLQLIGVMPGDVIGLRIVDSGGGLVESSADDSSFRLRGPSTDHQLRRSRDRKYCVRGETDA
jgi:hypothetical protein